MIHIGKNINNFRTRLQLSQQDLANFLGKKREQIAYYESGKRTPSIEDLEKLSDLFGIELEMLFEEEPSLHEVDLAFAFRKDSINQKTLKVIADFNQIAKTYIKVRKLEEDCNE